METVRAKYQNLKYEYRTVKHAHRSGDSSKMMKLFHDLDAILQSEPSTQLREEKDGNSTCLATLSSMTAPDTTEGKKKNATLLSVTAFTISGYV